MSALDALLAALRRKAGGDFAWSGEAVAWCFGRRTGERHLLTLRFDDPAPAARLACRLGDHQFVLPGYLVADIGCTCREAAGTRVAIEALTFAAD